MTALFAGELATDVNKGPDKGYWDMLWSSSAVTLNHPERHTPFSQAHTLPLAAGADTICLLTYLASGRWWIMLALGANFPVFTRATGEKPRRQASPW